MPMSAATRQRFANPTVEGFVKAGTPAALEQLGGGFENVSCVVCGTRIGNVFLTDHGPMGGDCLATLTGDDSTRASVRKLYEALRYADKAVPVEVGAAASPGHVAVRQLRQVGFDEYAGRARYTSGRTMLIVKLRPEIVRAMAEDAGLRVVDRTPPAGGKRRHGKAARPSRPSRLGQLVRDINQMVR
jgi:hypothetical protein